MPLNPVQICTRCDQAESPCGGFCRCRQSGKDLLYHQAHVYCPLALYGTGSDAKPPGWDELPDTPPAAPEANSDPAIVPRSEWPAWAVTVAKFAKPQDKGVGDTLERLINAGMGLGDAWKALRATLRLPCNCERDRDRLNVLYPLTPSA